MLPAASIPERDQSPPRRGGARSSCRGSAYRIFQRGPAPTTELQHVGTRLSVPMGTTFPRVPKPSTGMSRNQKELAGLSRREYLQALVTEFQVTDSSDAKEQVLANLANFAYNPQNYEYLRQLKVLDLFLDMLTEDNNNLVEFALGGLCNLCLDKINKDYILEAGGVSAVVNCLASANEETVLSAVTTLMYLSTARSRQEITTLPVIECMLRFSLSNNRRLKNLATIFLEDYCSPFQVEQARSLTKHTAVGIPLPKDECSPGGSQDPP